MVRTQAGRQRRHQACLPNNLSLIKRAQQAPLGRIGEFLVMHIFSTCPHDNMTDPEKWVALMEYLNDSCALQLRYERHTDFKEFERNFERFDVVYAHPLHALRLATGRGFVPL